MGPENAHITELLKRWSSDRGEDAVLDKLMPLVYDELHRQAARFLRRERQDHTLQTTALINEAYLKLIDQKHTHWENRLHFFGVAAQVMRRILVDHARSKHRVKRGARGETTSINDKVEIAVDNGAVDFSDLDEALSRLARMDEQKARIVELRYFAGLSVIETAQVMDISVKTVERHWTMAKAWLHRELR
ncbi:MAG: sigma-70 family RNA polymerase sigma factor [Pyrinomonadaceae bacterium]